jgi:hypothetical protein
MISPNMSPAVKELLNRIGGNPAGPAAAAPTLRATSASPILTTTPGRAHYGVVPPQPASAAARGTLNIVNAALRDVNQTLQQEAERLQSTWRGVRRRDFAD